MNIDDKPAPAKVSRRGFGGWAVFTALFYFGVGSLATLSVIHVKQTRTHSNRVFQLMIYHTLPGKAPALESIFRDVSKLQANHDLNVIGYWVPNDDPAWANTFIYLVAHSGQAEAEKNWDALHADPAFLKYRSQAAPLIEKAGEDYKVDEVFMRPTDYSPIK